MNIRGANKGDSKFIQEIFKEHEFKLDPDHLEWIMIAEDDEGKPIALMSLNTVLECSFLTVGGAKRRDKIEALRQMVKVGTASVKDLKYDLVHAFANDKIRDILVKHFGFQKAQGTNLVLFVE